MDMKKEIYYIQTTQTVCRKYAVATDHQDDALRLLVHSGFPKDNKTESILLIEEENLKEEIDDEHYNHELKKRHSVK